MRFNIFAYRTIPVTILISAIYIGIFIALFLTDVVPDIPQDTHGLDVERAYADLYNITARPHPYHSHANDVVRSFLIDRIDEITAGCDYAHLQEDNDFKFWQKGPNAVVFQSSNILIKIDGYDERFVKGGGVLFSAHYDSVSTSPGATDDGMAVVSLIQLIEHLVNNRPRRTAIFNINNGEEDGLHGARAFVQHPWIKLADTFINLEGAGAGGTPLLFRATSLEPVKAFSQGITTKSTTYRVRHPHGNVLSADAFNRGVVRSGTDFSIYNTDDSHRKLEGVDLAFYKRRSRYHTMYDSIPGMEGKAKLALWAMMESVWGAGGVLLNIESTKPMTGKPAVYFDLFKTFFIVFELESLRTFNFVLLFVGPALVLLLHVALPFFCNHFDHALAEDKPSVISRVFGPFRRSNGRHQAEDDPYSGVLSSSYTHVANACSWAKLWIPAVFTLSTLLYIVTTKVLLVVNRYITYSQQYTMMFLNLSLGLIVITFLLGSPAITARIRSSRPNVVYVMPDRQAILLHLYIITYLLLILAAYSVESKIGGLYWISAWHAGVSLACVFGGVETFLARAQRIKEIKRRKRGNLLRREANRATRNNRHGHRRGGSSSSDSDEEANENTPLLPGSLTDPEQGGDAPSEKDNSAWWILQVLLTVPIPVMLVGHVLLLFQGALGQTLSDGSSAAFVYVAEALLCFFIILPVAPFASGVHRYVTYIATLSFLATLIFNLATFPFTQEAPLKVFFQQSVQLNTTSPTFLGSNLAAEDVLLATSSLTGVPELVGHQLISQLPSSWGKEISCGTDEARRRAGLVTCSWDTGSDMIPYPGGRQKQPWLVISGQRLGPTKVLIEVEGKNTRSCRAHFDEMQIVDVVLKGKDQTPALTLAPISEKMTGSWLRYWSRKWGKKIAIEVNLKEPGLVNGTTSESQASDGRRGNDIFRILRGRVACEWAEYQTGMVGLDLNELRGAGYLNPKIPALEEAFRLLPQWVTVSKADDGLVEGWSEFEI